jgi:hypothetical protein
MARLDDLNRGAQVNGVRNDGPADVVGSKKKATPSRLRQE